MGLHEGMDFPGTSDDKNLPAMQETQVRSLGQEDSLEKGSNPLQYSRLENSVDYRPWGGKESDTTKRLTLTLQGNPRGQCLFTWPQETIQVSVAGRGCSEPGR